MFDVNKLFDTVQRAVQTFAESHREETFYAFAIDAGMLCLNSVEDFAKTLAEYKASWPEKYAAPEAIEDLKFNTGDWLYQGFFDLDEDHGFDRDAYDDHYYEAGESEDGTASQTAYAIAMTELVERLRASDVFDVIRQADDFRILWVEHTY